MMNDEHLREKIRSILDEGNGMYGYERVDQLLALIHEERKGAVEEASHLLTTSHDAIDWTVFSAEAPEGYRVAIERMKDIQFCMFPTAP